MKTKITKTKNRDLSQNKANKYFEVVFVRHAETQPNVNGLTYNNYTDEEYYPITKHSELQAFETGKEFKKRFKSNSFDMVFSSPRQRCIQIAERILKGINTNKKIVTDELLLEGVAGIFNMKTESERELIKENNKDKQQFYKKRSELRKEKKIQVMNLNYLI